MFILLDHNDAIYNSNGMRDMCDINFQPKMDVIKEELDSHSLSSHGEGEQVTDIKHEDDPVPEPFCIVKTEAYVSRIIYLLFYCISECQSGPHVYLEVRMTVVSCPQSFSIIWPALMEASNLGEVCTVNSQLSSIQLSGILIKLAEISKKVHVFVKLFKDIYVMCICSAAVW
jgi:hypothetical protein